MFPREMTVDLGDRFAMFVGKVVIGSALVYGASVVIGPFVKNLRVNVTWSSDEDVLGNVRNIFSKKKPKTAPVTEEEAPIDGEPV